MMNLKKNYLNNTFVLFIQTINIKNFLFYKIEVNKSNNRYSTSISIYKLILNVLRGKVVRISSSLEQWIENLRLDNSSNVNKVRRENTNSCVVRSPSLPFSSFPNISANSLHRVT